MRSGKRHSNICKQVEEWLSNDLLVTGWSYAKRMELCSRPSSWLSVRVRRTSSGGCIGAVSCAPCKAAFHQTAYSTIQPCKAWFKMKMVSESILEMVHKLALRQIFCQLREPVPKFQPSKGA